MIKLLTTNTHTVDETAERFNAVVLDKLAEFEKKKINIEYIEIEARLGTLTESTSDTRLKLPISGECILVPNRGRSNFAYQFVGHITKRHAQIIVGHLHEILGLSADSFGGEFAINKAEPCSKPYDINYSETVAKIIRLPNNNKVRAIVDRSTNTLVSLCEKRASSLLNVYTGYDQNEVDIEILLSESGQGYDTSVRTTEDFRLSINQELPVNQHLVFQDDRMRNDVSVIYERTRKRYSIPIGGLYKLEITQVLLDRETLYELEIELNSKAIYAVHKAGKPTLPIIKEYISMVRHFISIICNVKLSEYSTKSTGTPIDPIDLTAVGLSDTDLSHYLTYFSPVVPLIGGYACKLPLTDKLTDSDVEDSIRMELNQAEKDALDTLVSHEQ